jgi:uncharacterized protein (TIGR03578 family)
MSGYSRFHTEVITLVLTGTGETDEAALNQVLARMRQQVMQERKGPVLFMAPVHVEVLKRHVHTWTERFLGVLWPRERHRIDLEVRLDVEVRWLQFLSASQ